MHAGTRLTALAVAVGGILALTPAGAAKPCAHPQFLAANILAEGKSLDAAERLATSLLAKPETAVCAAKLLRQIAADRKRTEESKGILSRVGRKAWTSTESVLNWLFPVLVALAIVFGLGLLFRAASRLRRSCCDVSWRVRAVAPGSDPGLLSAWRAALDGQRRSSAGNLALLVQAGIALPKSIVAESGAKVDQSNLPAGGPEIHGVSLTWILGVWQAFKRFCTSSRRTLTIWSVAKDQSAMMRVEAQDAKGQLKTAAMSVAWTNQAEAAREIDRMAAAMALRTSYLIAEETSAGGAAARPRLHEGIERLAAYGSGIDSEALGQAAEAFTEARRLDPQDTDALLYEGIARELLEQHDLAQELFLEVVKRVPGTAACSQAEFNTAVSHLRRYKPDEILKAEQSFQALRTDAKTPVDLKAFATAALANAKAHRFIFWHAISTVGSPDFSEWGVGGAAKTAEVKAWSAEIDGLVAEAEVQLAEAPFAEDAEARTRLAWFIENARGNHALNRAGPAMAACGLSQKQSEDLLAQALAAYRRCEVLLPPGVETLTNLATTLLSLDRPSDAIVYARRARALNPRYEYAYMRETQAELAKGDRGAAVEVMKSARAALDVVRITEFKLLFKAHNVGFNDK
jgi:tetratricopeptide (TPR) repeat protein